MIIKEVPAKDLEKAKQIYCESFHKEYTKTTIKLLGKIIGIYLQEELIGLCQIDYINDIFENKKRAYINNFCIKKEYQNQGYGDILLKECIHILEKEEIDQINMTSNKTRIYAHKLYQKNKFQLINTNLFKKDLKKESTVI